jgi:site-specific recombinase XerD
MKCLRIAEGKAPSGQTSKVLLKQWLAIHQANGNIWGIDRAGIQVMLKRLHNATGIIHNPHTFRRTFASNLHRAGLDVEHIMRLGGWESLDMVLRYTRSVRFEESLRVMRGMQ